MFHNGDISKCQYFIFYNATIASTCGLYYKHVMIVNDNSGGISKWSFKLIDNASVVIYDRNMFIILGTDVSCFVYGNSWYNWQYKNHPKYIIKSIW